jgi:hypothetical protein
MTAGPCLSRQISNRLRAGPLFAVLQNMARYIAVGLGVVLAFLLLGSFGIFLLYATNVPLAFVGIILMVLALMFALGVQTGAKGIRISRFRNRRWPSVKSKAI